MANLVLEHLSSRVVFLFCILNLNKLEDLVCIVGALMMAQLLLDFLQMISFLKLCRLFEDSPKFIEFVSTKVCHL